MELAPQPFLDANRASVSDAKLAYFEGDFDRCLEICTNTKVRTLASASEVALLEARAYLRTGRPREAQTTLSESLEIHATLDASLTAEMLFAAARIRQNDADTGIAMLVSAAARSSDAHFAIRSEIAFCTALGHWAKRDIAAAEALLALVDPRSDIIHARALELQAWCYSARRDYRLSAEYFRLTLLRLDTCYASDRAISATAISTLAMLAAELFDRDIARFVNERAQRLDWSSGLQGQHYFTLLHQALFQEFAGNTVEAYQLATQAREAAPTVAFEVLGWGISSAIARNAGEDVSAIVYAKRAQRLLGSLNAADLVGDERFSILSVAENCAHFDPDKATDLFTMYWGLAPVNKMFALSGDPRLTADEISIEGAIAYARHEHDRARACFRKAFDMFSEIGYVRRATMSAYCLLKLDDDEKLRRYVASQLVGTTNYISAAIVPQADDTLTSLERHPIVASLPRMQREVISQICLGKTNKQVASWRNVGEQTIKNMLSKSIFPAFGVSNRAALVSACLRGDQIARA